MKPRSRIRGLFLALLGLGAAAVAHADDQIRFSHNVPGESKAIVLAADEITNWTEGSTNVFLVKGHVRIEQGAVWAQFQNGVVFVEQKGAQETHQINADVYGEGGAVVENGAERQNGATLLIDLHTGGDFRVNYIKGTQVIHQTRTNDPVYRRGVVQRGGTLPPLAPPTTDPIQRVGFTTPAETTQGPLPAPAPPPGTVPAPPGPGVGPLLGTPIAPPPPPPTVNRQFSLVPRNLTFNFQQLPGVRQLAGRPPERVGVATGGFILTVRSSDPRTNSLTILDIEADRGVFWTPADQNNKSPSADGGLSGREAEFYLAGNVEIREHAGRDERTMRAEEVYYDLKRNVALALTASVEWRQPGVPDLIVFRGDEIQELSQNQFKGLRGDFSSSKLPSDPGLKVQFSEATLDEKKQIQRNIFGREVIDLNTDQPVVEVQKLIHADDVVLRVEEVPVFWLPFIQGDANDPLGPVREISAGYNRIYGFEGIITWDVYNLIGITRVPNTSWKMDTDYLSNRGPALGSQFDFAGKDPFGVPGIYTGHIDGWTIVDHGEDQLGGDRTGQPHPEWRGWLLASGMIRDLPAGFSVQAQGAYISDQNVYEQYRKNQFDTEPNKETSIYFKQQQDEWGWTGLLEPRIRDWVNETESLPRLDGYLIGESLFDTISYSAHASAGYFELMPTNLPPFPADLTTRRVNTARLDLMQQASVPFYLGPVKVVPYGLFDLTSYSEDLDGNSVGRIYGGAGVKASIPFTRLYPDIHSLLWNLDGINHKIVASANYYYASTDVPYTRLPQLDRLNDDVNDFSYNEMKPLQPSVNPVNGLALATNPIYDPQSYALRNLVLNKIDTLGTEEELQFDVRQRWQTKRGFPGNEHIVDWMTLDLSATVFPAGNRDNFGSNLGYLQYDWTWNIGDRTALTSNGWIDPADDGPRFFSFGAYFNRTDRTSLFLGYRQIDPLQSKAVTAAFTYVFSPKYAMTTSSTYDFGTSEALSNSLVLTRIGSDLQLSFGITYNALTNSVGVVVEVIPNLLSNRRVPGLSNGMLQH